MQASDIDLRESVSAPCFTEAEGQSYLSKLSLPSKAEHDTQAPQEMGCVLAVGEPQRLVPAHLLRKTELGVKYYSCVDSCGSSSRCYRVHASRSSNTCAHASVSVVRSASSYAFSCAHAGLSTGYCAICPFMQQGRTWMFMHMSEPYSHQQNNYTNVVSLSRMTVQCQGNMPTAIASFWALSCSFQ